MTKSAVPNEFEKAEAVELEKIEAAEKAAEKPAEKPAKKALKMYKITFHTGEGEDNSDVILGHNYQLNRYKRNVEVPIDENFLGVLEDAVVLTADGTETGVKKPRYSYSVKPA